MKKGKKRLLASLFATILAVTCCFGFSMSSYAYWWFGTVGVSLGKSSVNLTTGQSETVSVSLSPASSDQLPGCGMEECPRICGDKNCYNNQYGQCICDGSKLTTYYPTATVSSSNTSVATASYGNGAVTINAVGAGSATITVTGSLRQYYDSSATIAVNVAAPAASSGSSGSGSAGNSGSSGNSGNTGNSGTSNGSGGTGSSGSTGGTGGSGSTGNSGTSNGSGGTGSSGSSGNSGNSGNSVSVTQVSGTDSSSTGDAEGEIGETEAGEERANGETGADEEVTSLESDKGTIWFVPIIGLPQGKEQFEKIRGDDSQYVNFQLKDDAENVIYAWEFCGKDVTRAEDMVFTIESSRNAFEGCPYGSSADSLYLAFAEEGEFVGKTTISYRVSDYFSDDDVLYLYCYNPEDGTIELVAEGLTIDNGYVNMELTEGGYYILSTEELSAEAEPEEEVSEEESEEPEETDVLSEPEADGEVAEEHTGLSAGVIAAIVIIAAVIAALIIFLCVRAVRKKRQGPTDGDETGNIETPEESAETESEEGAAESVADSVEAGSEDGAHSGSKEEDGEEIADGANDGGAEGRGEE